MEAENPKIILLGYPMSALAQTRIEESIKNLDVELVNLGTGRREDLVEITRRHNREMEFLKVESLPHKDWLFNKPLTRRERRAAARKLSKR